MRDNEPEWVGPLVGVNLQGYPTPFMFDPHSSINSPLSKSHSSGILITGGPGSGKSFLGYTLAMISAISGKDTIIVDPKNDARNMIKLSDELDGLVHSIDMSSGGQNGAMDPFVSDKDRAERVARVSNLTKILLGDLDSEESTGLYAKIQDVANMPDPSLSLLCDELARNQSRKVSNLGIRLKKIGKSDPKVGSAIFRSSRARSRPQKIGKGLTIITTLGMDIPNEGTDASMYTDQNRLAMGIMYLIANYLWDTVSDPSQYDLPKTILMDEAWALLATQQGLEIANTILRKSRSFNAVLILMTQNIKEINDSDFQSLMSTRFAFHADDPDTEGQELCKSLRIDPGYAQTFPDLTQGQCFVRDYKNRVSVIQIIEQSPLWTRAFNPHSGSRV